MKENKDCKIVQDLLPNYIEKLTNKETNEYIEEHLKECSECRKVVERMKKDINVEDKKIDKREVKYIKKFSNKMRILKLILLTLILIYIAVVLRRTFIMTSLYRKANENRAYDNYYAKVYSYQGDTLTITESYNKGEDYLTTITRLVNGKNIQKITYYKKGEEQLFITESEGEKYILNPETKVGGYIVPATCVSDGILTNLQYALIIGIDSTYCNGKECYVIKGENYEWYIDKENGLATRMIQKVEKGVTMSADLIVDYEYKFNTVTDEEIAKPDTTGYVAKEN